MGDALCKSTLGVRVILVGERDGADRQMSCLGGDGQDSGLEEELSMTVVWGVRKGQADWQGQGQTHGVACWLSAVQTAICDLKFMPRVYSRRRGQGREVWWKGAASKHSF